MVVGEGIVINLPTVHGNLVANNELALQVLKLYDMKQDHPVYNYRFEEGSFAAIPNVFCKIL